MNTKRNFAAGLGIVLLGGFLLWAGTRAGAAPARPADGTEALPPGASIQTVLPGMDQPIAMAFDPQGRLFYTERATGNVRLYANGTLQPAPVITFAVDSCGERGLLGIALDPNFSSNHYIYVYYTADPGTPCGATVNRVVRFIENNGVGSNPSELFSSLQTAPNHVGGNLHFGPDGKLYISIGENATPQNAQNVQDKRGKIHRLNPDGSIPPDNPVFTQTGALPSLYAMGLRNSFDFTFDPADTGAPWRIFASENGPNCDDELNRIEPAFNYGWRVNYPCDDATPDPATNTIAPLWYLPQGQCCEAPTGVLVYNGSQVPQWHNELFMVTYAGKLRHHYLNPARTALVNTNEVLGVTANTDIAVGPDGALWYIEGGGYETGTLKRIVGPGGAPSPTPGPSPCPIQFSDVPPTDPFYAFVRCLACRQIVSGYGDGTFRPGASVTRGQLSKITAGAAGLTNSIPSSRQTFSDVPNSNTFWLWIERLAGIGAINGYACGGAGEPCDPQNRPYLRWGANATRGQIAKITVVAAGWQAPIPTTQQTFADVPPTNVFWFWIEHLATRQIVSGYTCGGPGEPCDPQNRPYFRWGANTTRGQMSKIAANAFFPNCSTPAMSNEQ